MKKVFLGLVLVVLGAQVAFAGEWEQNGDAWLYQEDGVYVENQQKKIDGKWYYFGQDGAMLTGYNKIENKFYVFNADGTPKTEPIQFNGKTYEVDGKGNIKGIKEEEFEKLIENDFVINSGSSAVTSVINHAKELLPIFPSKYSLKLKLTSEGITTDLIDYAIYNAGVNWKEQAIKTAVFWLKLYNLDRDKLKAFLIVEGFTDAEVSYGVEMSFDDGKIAEYKTNQSISNENIANTIATYYNSKILQK